MNAMNEKQNIIKTVKKYKKHLLNNREYVETWKKIEIQFENRLS